MGVGLPGVKENCKFSMPLVDDYMRVAEHWEECKDAPSFGAAIAKLTKKHHPKPKSGSPSTSASKTATIDRTEVQKRMKDHNISGTVEDVVAFLESFGVRVS